MTPTKTHVEGGSDRGPNPLETVVNGINKDSINMISDQIYTDLNNCEELKLNRF